jgi:hypothetical protein
MEDLRKTALALQKPLSDIHDLNRIVGEIAHRHADQWKSIRDSFSVKYSLPKEITEFSRRLNEQFRVNAALLRDFDRSLRRQLEEINTIFEPLRHAREGLLSAGQHWVRTIEGLPDFRNRLLQQQILESTVTWQLFTDTVSQRISELNLIKSHPSLSARLIEPGLLFSDYSARVTARVERSSDEKEVNALSGSLTLAQEQLEDSTELVADIIVVPEDSEERPIIAPVYNSFTEQEQELLACDFLPAEQKYDILLTHSVSGQIAERSRRCVELVLYCNKANNLLGGADIFKPTTKFTESCALLSYTIAKDQSSLQNFVEHLYFILYEGAGKDNLRFVTEGFVSAEEDSFEIDAVMYVKFLRNKWLSHDPDHGKESHIKKTWRDLKEALAELGITRLPQAPEDFTELQMRLLDSIEAFLKLLAERISNKAGSGNN